jgi:hypothetical protein
MWYQKWESSDIFLSWQLDRRDETRRVLYISKEKYPTLWSFVPAWNIQRASRCRFHWLTWKQALRDVVPYRACAHIRALIFLIRYYQNYQLDRMRAPRDNATARSTGKASFLINWNTNSRGKSDATFNVIITCGNGYNLSAPAHANAQRVINITGRH